MKKNLLIVITACAIFASGAEVQAAPISAKRRVTRISTMCADEETRIMMIHELTRTRKGKQEMVRELAHDDEFRSYYETHTLNPG